MADSTRCDNTSLLKSFQPFNKTLLWCFAVKKTFLWLLIYNNTFVIDHINGLCSERTSFKPAASNMVVRDLWHFHLLLICLRCGLVQTLNQRITENPTWKPFSKKMTLLSRIIKRFLFLKKTFFRSRSPSVTEGRDLTGGFTPFVFTP